MDIVYILNIKYKVWQVNEFLIVKVIVYKVQLTKVTGIDFKSAVLNLYYQKI